MIIENKKGDKKMKKIKITNILFEQEFGLQKHSFEGEVWFQFGSHKCWTKFIMNFGKDNIPIAILQSDYQKFPDVDIKTKRLILTEIYAEAEKILYHWEAESYFRHQEEEERAEAKRKAEEERKKRIGIGEQVTFEKWLANEKK